MRALSTVSEKATAVIVLASIGASNWDSYLGLHVWAVEHGDQGSKADLFPFFIDAFPLTAELFMFRAILERWGRKSLILPGIVLTLGLGVSVAINIGQEHAADVFTQLTQAAAPLASWLSLLVGSFYFEHTQAAKARKAAESLKDDEDQDQGTDQDEDHDTDQDQNEDHDTNHLPLDLKRAMEVFADDIGRGQLPGLARIRASLKPCGHRKAEDYQKYLDSVIKARQRQDAA